jgi:hypothetical protein
VLAYCTETLFGVKTLEFVGSIKGGLSRGQACDLRFCSAVSRRQKLKDGVRPDAILRFARRSLASQPQKVLYLLIEDRKIAGLTRFVVKGRGSGCDSASLFNAHWLGSPPRNARATQPGRVLLRCDLRGGIAPAALAQGGDGGDAEPVACAAGQAVNCCGRLSRSARLCPAGRVVRIEALLDQVTHCVRYRIPTQVQLTFVIADGCVQTVWSLG